MPITYRIDPGRGLVYVEVRGHFSTDDIVACMEAALHDPEFRPGFDVLSDHTAIEDVLTPAQAREVLGVLQRNQAAVAGSRWAVVTVHPASYGMFRMVAVLAERVGLAVSVFQSREEAETWLAEGNGVAAADG